MSEKGIHANLGAIEYYLPQEVLTNEMLAAQYPEWSIKKIFLKTGIKIRNIAAKDECASDLAYQAAMKLFDKHNIKPTEIDFILLCTQSPDYFLPTTACILQNRLGIPTTAGALDFNLGCSGYIYGLSLAKGLVESGQAQNVLLLTSETYSKYLAEKDKSVRTIFADGASASLIQSTKCSDSGARITSFAFGTNGSGAENLIVRAGAARQPKSTQLEDYQLKMNGAEIFTFTLNSVPEVIDRVLAIEGLVLEEIDQFIFHQANAYMLTHLRNKMGIPKEKFVTYIENVGNTVSSTLPIAYRETEKKQNSKIMLVGFGVGYSWGATILET